MRTLEKIGPLSLVEDRSRYHLRWWDKNLKRQRSEALGPDLDAARAEVYKRAAASVRPDDIIERPSDPTFEEVWIFYKREKSQSLSAGRSRRLDELWKLFFKPALAKVPNSKLTDAIRGMRDRLHDGWTGDNRDESRGARTRPLAPNTIEDIVNIARAVINFSDEKKLIKGLEKIPSISVAGTTKPIDREPKGRHLTMTEIGKLIDACKARHHLHLLLLDLGCASRTGGFFDLTDQDIFWDLHAIDMLPEGTKQSAKFRPVIPVTGPMVWVVAEAVRTAGPDHHIIHERAQRLHGKNGFQIIQRVARRALGENGAVKVNWYSIRHTLIDWLEMRVPARSLSVLAGHVSALDSRERRQLRKSDGSKTTLIYFRKKLEHLDPIRKVLDEEWWPEIQKHCETDLRLGDKQALKEWNDARKHAQQMHNRCK